jgi:hypothetical protein
MLLLDAIVVLVAIGCATGIAKMLIARLGNPGERVLRGELRVALERIALLERENSHLEEQVEWHKRLVRALETKSGEPVADAPPAVGDRTTAG